MHRVSSSSSLLKSTLNFMAFKCSDICTLHVCKLCLNSSDEFQAFTDFLPGLHTKVKRQAALEWQQAGWGLYEWDRADLYS